MQGSNINNLKLGAFIVAGMAFLILMLYMIGRNRNLFQSTYTLKAHVQNAQGLVIGNNVRYAGIEVGTVQKIKFLNDSLIELSLTINSRMKNIIRKNAKVTIGTEGIVGNKVLNIVASKTKGEIANEGDILSGSVGASTEDMLLVLEKTNNDVAVIAAELKKSIERLNDSKGIWKMLDDQQSADNIRRATQNISSASSKAEQFVEDLQALSSFTKEGKGNVGMLLKDTAAMTALNESVIHLRRAAGNADSLTHALNDYAADVYHDIKSGNNTINVLLKDSILADKVRLSLGNVEKGTASFTANMEALRHNILFRGYFRKQAKKQKKEQKNSESVTVISNSDE